MFINIVVGIPLSCIFFAKPIDEELVFAGWILESSGRRITVKGITYPTMEHAYQAAKFRLTDHPIIARKFRHGGSITCPKAAREFGSREGLEDIGVNLDREKWRQVKHDVFNHIVLKRAEQDSFFKQLLHP